MQRRFFNKHSIVGHGVLVAVFTLATGCSSEGMWDQVAGNKSVPTGPSTLETPPAPSTPPTGTGTSNVSVLQGTTLLAAGMGTYSFGTIGTRAIPTGLPVIFTIQNLSSDASLNITGATISGANAADFRRISAPALSVAASSTTTLRVVFVPQDQGVRTATLTVSSNDTVTPSYSITLTGTGDGPCAGPFTPAAIKRIFATATPHTGNLGGVALADAVCMADATAVTNNGCWKAILGDETDRTTAINWIMQAHKDYYRNDGTTKILRTNSSGGLTNDTSSPCSGAGGSYSLCNNFTTAGNYWTGLNANWSVSPTRTCSRWTRADGTGEIKGRYGLYSQVINLAIQGTSGTNENCDQVKRILCVEI